MYARIALILFQLLSSKNKRKLLTNTLITVFAVIFSFILIISLVAIWLITPLHYVDPLEREQAIAEKKPPPRSYWKVNKKNIIEGETSNGEISGDYSFVEGGKFENYAPTQDMSVPNVGAVANCTWYVADRVKQLGGIIPGMMGNGGEWSSYAARYGLPVSKQAKAGTAVCMKKGVASRGYVDYTYGHIMFCEEVFENGDILVSEGNWYDDSPSNRQTYGGIPVYNGYKGKTILMGSKVRLSAAEAQHFDYIDFGIAS